MKKLIGIVLVSSILWGFGCGKSPGSNNLDGKWRGTVTEKGKSTLVQLELREQQGMIEGTFSILSETGEDLDKGMAFSIVQAERSGNRLKFIVPISEGQVDDDAIAFELLLEGEILKGHGHELREGSDNLPVIFTKHE